MKINKAYVLYYMNQSGLYNNSKIAIDSIEIKPSGIWHNGANLATVYSKNNDFLPWGITEVYYKDVILYLVKDMRDDKLKELGI